MYQSYLKEIYTLFRNGSPSAAIEQLVSQLLFSIPLPPMGGRIEVKASVGNQMFPIRRPSVQEFGTAEVFDFIYILFFLIGMRIVLNIKLRF